MRWGCPCQSVVCCGRGCVWWWTCISVLCAGLFDLRLLAVRANPPSLTAHLRVRGEGSCSLSALASLLHRNTFESHPTLWRTTICSVYGTEKQSALMAAVLWCCRLRLPVVGAAVVEGGQCAGGEDEDVHERAHADAQMLKVGGSEGPDSPNATTTPHRSSTPHAPRRGREVRREGAALRAECAWLCTCAWCSPGARWSDGRARVVAPSRRRRWCTPSTLSEEWGTTQTADCRGEERGEAEHQPSAG